MLPEDVKPYEKQAKEVIRGLFNLGYNWNNVMRILKSWIHDVITNKP